MWKLLTIDDDPDRTEQIADWFGSIGFKVIRAHSGRDGLEQARETHPDVILLDIMMPQMDGHEVLLRLKRDPITETIPVVICSFKAEELEGLQDLLRTGLREGADYVMAKKWGFPSLEEVVMKFLRPAERPLRIQIGSYQFRFGEKFSQIWINEYNVKLTRLEADVLAYLNEHRGKSCSVEEMADHVWHDKGKVGDENRVRRVVERLRAKLEPDPSNPIFIVTEKGFGYKLSPGD